MAYIRTPRGWEIPEREATPESAFINRRQFIKTVTAAGIAGTGLISCGQEGPGPTVVRRPSLAPIEVPQVPPPSLASDLYPAKRNEKFTVERPLTAEEVAGKAINYYEFSTQKPLAARLAGEYQPRLEEMDWKVSVKGLANGDKELGIDDLVRMASLEERVYRFRCVEAWAMTVPWTGFSLSEFIKKVEPKSSAKYVRFVTSNDQENFPGVRQQPRYPWPYFEGLTMPEAMNELTMMVTGIYGHPLPMAHGAPIRLIVPWKYGFKSIKSIVEIEFTEEKPKTFWNTASPGEYGFEANVDPEVPHPRWSQARERDVATGNKRDTLLYNGYGEWVADLYA